jgi:hypothetical protein
MRRRTAQLTATLVTTGLALLVLVPAAFAGVGGEGTYGETNDRVVTNAGFIVIAFFPLLVFVLSIVQWRLDKRKDARKAAAKHRKSSADWQGGW